MHTGAGRNTLAHSPHGICWHGGRRGVELALGKAKEIVSDIAESCNSSLVSLRQSLDKAAFDQLVMDAEHIGSRVCAPLSLKLDSMWDNSPLVLFGFFGEFAGFSSAVVVAHMRKCLRMFAEADKSTLDRVTMSYLGDDASHLQSFLLKIQTGRPLLHFRNAWMFVRGHAMALLVSRRNEGDHRNLTLETRSTHNVGVR